MNEDESIDIFFTMTSIVSIVQYVAVRPISLISDVVYISELLHRVKGTSSTPRSVQDRKSRR